MPRPPGPPCAVDGCPNKHASLGLCATHYARKRRGQQLDAPIKGKGGVCRVDGCEKRITAHFLCPAHYSRLRSGRDLGAPLRPLEAPPCSVDGCETPRYSHGMCGVHHHRLILRPHELARNAISRDHATHHGEIWTGPQLEQAVRDDVPLDELARRLGRTLRALQNARTKARATPREVTLAGVGGHSG